MGNGDQKLCRIGGIAALATVALYLVEFLTFSGMPSTTLEWLALFERSRFLGLFYINALDIFSVALLCPMFLALHRILKRDEPAWAKVATSLALLGITVFITTRAILTSGTLVLSGEYASAATEAERGPILAAVQAIHALGQASPQTVGFFFMAAAVSIISLAMLRGGRKNGVYAITGLLVGASTLADDALIIAAPSSGPFMIAVSGLVWTAWWIMTGIKLIKESQ